jgi:hypothetical protein
MTCGSFVRDLTLKISGWTISSWFWLTLHIECDIGTCTTKCRNCPLDPRLSQTPRSSGRIRGIWFDSITLMNEICRQSHFWTWVISKLEHCDDISPFPFKASSLFHNCSLTASSQAEPSIACKIAVISDRTDAVIVISIANGARQARWLHDSWTKVVKSLFFKVPKKSSSPVNPQKSIFRVQLSAGHKSHHSMSHLWHHFGRQNEHLWIFARTMNLFGDRENSALNIFGETDPEKENSSLTHYQSNCLRPLSKNWGIDCVCPGKDW